MKKKIFQKEDVRSNIILLSNNKILLSKAKLIDANMRGFYFTIDEKKARKILKSIGKVLNHEVKLNFSQYECDLEGVFKNMKKIKKDIFKVHVGYLDNTPKMYKECVLQLIS